MSLTNHHILPNLYAGLGIDRHESTLSSPAHSKFLLDPANMALRTDMSNACNAGMWVDSEPPSDIPTPALAIQRRYSTNLNYVNVKLESLSRNRNGQLPVLEHLLNESDSRALSLGMSLSAPLNDLQN
jgi:hypothetical protein